jgi:hypothetical protein
MKRLASDNAAVVAVAEAGAVGQSWNEGAASDQVRGANTTAGVEAKQQVAKVQRTIAHEVWVLGLEQKYVRSLQPGNLELACSNESRNFPAWEGAGAYAASLLAEPGPQTLGGGDLDAGMVAVAVDHVTKVLVRP